MLIGLNLLPLRPGVGGSFNYVDMLIAALARYDHENEYAAFVTAYSKPMIPQQVNFRVIELRGSFAGKSARVLYENSLLPSAIRRAGVDCVHHVFGTLPFPGGTKSVVSIYDLMDLARPGDFGPVKRAYLRVMRHRAARRATILAPMSHATADDLHRRFGVPFDRMEIVPPAIEPRFARQPDESIDRFRQHHGLPREFWLSVAGGLPHKNYPRLIAAFADLRRRHPDGWPLVIRGEPTPELVALIERHAVTDRVSFMPRLPAGEMPLLFSAASALVFPSLFEGGGIPVMEAMACSCPVVASSIPSVIEFAGDAALMFDPTDTGEITGAMHDCEEQRGPRDERVRVGLVAVSRLAPEHVAAACMRAYARALRG